MTISVIVPVFRNAGVLASLHRRLAPVAASLDQSVEMVFVDDGSDDGSWAVIRQLASVDERVIGLRLASNVGQQRAILAGVAESSGDVLVTLDADLGNAPEDIPLLLRAFDRGHDCVIARRTDGEPRDLLRSLGSRVVNAGAALAGIHVFDVGSSFLVLDRRLARPIAEEFRRTGLELMLPSIVRLSRSPCWVEVDAPASGTTSSYDLRTLAPMGAAFLTIHVGGRLATVSAMASLTSACASVVARRGARRWRIGAAVCATVAIGSVAVSELARRPIRGAFYEIAERADLRSLTTPVAERMVQ